MLESWSLECLKVALKLSKIQKLLPKFQSCCVNLLIFIRLMEQTRDSYGVLPNETFSSDRLFVPKVNKSSKKFTEIEISMKSSTFFVLDMLF